MIRIASLDHLVLTVADIDRATAFYERVLGMQAHRFESGGVTRHALGFGAQKFNLHEVGQRRRPERASRDARVGGPLPAD